MERHFYYTYFSLCSGNDNNFETMDECIENCIGPREVLEAGEEAAGSSLVISTTTLEPTNNAVTSVANPNQHVNVCELPKSLGTCLILSIRYYYDYTTNSCKRFRYSGCGGNGNNFLNGEDCVRTCGGVLEKDRRAPEPKVSQRILEAYKNRTEAATTAPTTTSTSTTTTTTTKTTTARTTTEENGLFKRRVNRVRVVSAATAPVSSAKDSSKTTVTTTRKRLSPFTPKGGRTTTTTTTTQRPTAALRTRSRLRAISRTRYFPTAAPFVQTTESSSSSEASDRQQQEEEEKMRVSTQTSRSVVVVARARAKNNPNEVPQSSDSRLRPPPTLVRHSAAAAAILGNVTRATPSGIRYYQRKFQRDKYLLCALCLQAEADAPLQRSQRVGSAAVRAPAQRSPSRVGGRRPEHLQQYNVFLGGLGKHAAEVQQWRRQQDCPRPRGQGAAGAKAR